MGVTHQVLLLGSGFVTKPTVEILSKSNIGVTVACRSLENAKELAKDFANASAISLDVKDESALDEQVRKHDLVISLIPYTHHVDVIKSAIRHKKNVVTTSYVSPAMAELDSAAKEAGITVMNEIGLDPGIDHLYAVKTIDEVHREGGKILGFLSYCGGLPAPEASDNPLGYKFSWSPRGFLLACRNAARFWEDGKVRDIAADDVMSSASPYFIYPGFAFFAYANRDSTPYKERYDIPEAQTIIRGSLRYQGFVELIKAIIDLGFLRQDELDFLKSPIPWKEATKQLIGASSTEIGALESAIVKKIQGLSNEEQQRILRSLRWLGLLSDAKITPRGTPLDTLCATLEEKMQYAEGERDLVMLQHKFEIEHKDGSRETRTSTLCDYGDPKGYSSMARLVGTPCAVAVQRVLDGSISERGILAPLKTSIAEPLRLELRDKYGIEMVEKTLA